MTYYGYKLKKDDDRYEKYKQQRKSRGFDDSELWNLDRTIAAFVLPRLKVFREQVVSQEDEWSERIDKVIAAFEIINRQEPWFHYGVDKEETSIVDEGLKWFAVEFMGLWY